MPEMGVQLLLSLGASRQRGQRQDGAARGVPLWVLPHSARAPGLRDAGQRRVRAQLYHLTQGKDFLLEPVVADGYTYGRAELEAKLADSKGVP